MADTAFSSASLMAEVPADLFTGGDSPAPDTYSSSASGGETFETPGEVGGDAAPVIDENGFDENGKEVETDEPLAEDEPIAEDPIAAAPAPTGEELPEGVRAGKDSNGKPGLFLEPARYEKFHGAYKDVQAFSELLGEPLTQEALQVRNDAFHGQERLFADLNSGEAETQGKVIDYLLDQMAGAKERGEVGVDPSVPFAKQLFQSLQAKAPDAYAHLRMDAAKAFIGEMFQFASQNGDEGLFLSAQNMARQLAGFGKDVNDVAQVRAAAERAGIPFHIKAEMGNLARGADPLQTLRQENEALQARLNGRSGATQAEQFEGWFKTTATNVNSAVLDNAIKPSLASVEKAYEKFPADYQRLVVEPLHREVAKVIAADGNFKATIDRLHAQARRATSAQVRDSIAQQIQSSYVNRAKLAAEAVKRPILEFAANSLKGQSDKSHDRRAAAQTRTAPKGTASPVPRSLTPPDLIDMGDTFDPKRAMANMNRLLSV